MLFKNTVHENVLLFSRIYLYVHRIISNRNVPYFIRKICDLISCNPFQPTNQPLITSPALRWPIYRIHGGVCIKWHAITAVSAYIDIGSNFFYCLARHEEATMARVLISREMRLRSFDAATQSIRTYLWLYPVFFHAVSFVNYAYAYFTSLPFGVHSACVRRRFYRLKKDLVSKENCEGSCRLQVSVATTRPRYTESSCSPPRGGVHRYEYSHPVLDRHRGSLYYSLTPISTIRSEFPAARAKQHRGTNDTLDILARASS